MQETLVTFLPCAVPHTLSFLLFFSFLFLFHDHDHTLPCPAFFPCPAWFAAAHSGCPPHSTQTQTHPRYTTHRRRHVRYLPSIRSTLAPSCPHTAPAHDIHNTISTALSLPLLHREACWFHTLLHTHPLPSASPSCPISRSASFPQILNSPMPFHSRQ